MGLKSRIDQLFRRRDTNTSPESRGSETRCPGCSRKVPFWDFHRIPDIVALKSFENSIVKESATSGSFYVPGRFACGNGQYGSFVYCQDCNEKLTVAEKKVLIWHLCAHSPACDKPDALRRLERGEHLCAQIDKGL